jgi:hypothetical protein
MSTAAMSMMIPHNQQLHLLELVRAPEPMMPPLEVMNPTLAHIGMVVHAHNLLPQGPAVLAQLEAMPAVIQPLQTQCVWGDCDPCNPGVLVGTTDARTAYGLQPGVPFDIHLHGATVHALVTAMPVVVQPPFVRGAHTHGLHGPLETLRRRPRHGGSS